MTVTTLSLSRFRNIGDMVFSPCNGVNIIYGDNAQGKTNLIEALWLFTGAKSFRGAKDAELVAFESQRACLSLSFAADDREQTAEITLTTGAGKKKEVKLNGVQKDSVAALMGRFCAVVFSPAHLAIVSEGPGERRRFLDTAITQVRPVYDRLLSEYQKALTQRNALLRDLPYHSELADTVELWDERLAKTGASIMRLRIKYCKRLSAEASAIYAGIAGDKECLRTIYQPSIAPKDPDCTDPHVLYGEIRDALREGLSEDIKTGFTTKGIHRDDLDITIDGMPVRLYGSQGQRRSAVLSLKLAEGNLLKEVLGENPVILLDDVMSELDSARQEYILNHVKDRQVFITCCDSAVCGCLERGKTFFITNGSIAEGEETADLVCPLPETKELDE